MKTWTASEQVDAHPEAVLDVLTDTEARRRRSPVRFDIAAAAAS